MSAFVVTHQCGDCGATWGQDNTPACHAARGEPGASEGLDVVLAKALHATCDWEHYMGHEPSERDDMLAAGMAGWLTERGYAFRAASPVAESGHPDCGDNCACFARGMAVESDANNPWA